VIRRILIAGDGLLMVFVISLTRFSKRLSDTFRVSCPRVSFVSGGFEMKQEAELIFDMFVTTRLVNFLFFEKENGIGVFDKASLEFENSRVLFDQCGLPPVEEIVFGVARIASAINWSLKFLLTERLYEFSFCPLLRTDIGNLRRNKVEADEMEPRLEKPELLVWDLYISGGKVAVTGVDTGANKECFDCTDGDNFGERFLSGPLCKFFFAVENKQRRSPGRRYIDLDRASVDTVVAPLVFSTLRCPFEDSSLVEYEKHPDLGVVFSCWISCCCKRRFALYPRRESLSSTRPSA
jgi:hypothetical protein